MAKRLGPLERFVINLRNSFYVSRQKDIFVGSDKDGNQYFEREGDKTHNLRGSRFIKERTDLESDYSPDIPVEWNAWLRGMRKDPPTPEEIEKNYTTMMTTKLRAAKLERQFSRKELPESTGSAIAEDIKSNELNTPFPKYDDLEIAPGDISKKSKS